MLYSKYQDTVDRSIKKAVLVRGLHFNGRTVSDFFEEYEAYVAERGRRLTTANFNSIGNGFYTSHYPLRGCLQGTGGTPRCWGGGRAKNSDSVKEGLRLLVK